MEENNVLQQIHGDDNLVGNNEEFCDENVEVTIMPDDQFQNNVRQLNLEQRHIFRNISKVIEKEIKKEPVDQTLLFTSGGSGSRKSFILKLLVQLIRRCYASTVEPVSYTHLDVYKRQVLPCALMNVPQSMH